MGPVGVDGVDLRRIGATKIGATVDFEWGVMGGSHYPTSGACNVTVPRVHAPRISSSASSGRWVPVRTAGMMAKAVGISVSSVLRIWQAHGLQQHRMRRFKLSIAPAAACEEPSCQRFPFAGYQGW
jgi:hypothetical protein